MAGKRWTARHADTTGLELKYVLTKRATRRDTVDSESVDGWMFAGSVRATDLKLNAYYGDRVDVSVRNNKPYVRRKDGEETHD